MSRAEGYTTDARVAAYEACNTVFQGLLKEMRELSKKKADATLSKGKVKILNRVLDDVRNVVAGEPTEKYLDPLDDEDLPQNSDAVLVMVQYESALSAFRGRYHESWVSGLGNDIWYTKERFGEG